jgi:tRNA nucleotidyltransferase (CCA-adding enzyme)
MEVPLYLLEIFYDIAENDGHPYIVGGAVRDDLLGYPVKDFDIEVYGISADLLISLLEPYGKVDKVGKSFGVIMLHIEGVPAIEFALPRRENKEGRGHKGFIVEVDPSMTPEEGSARRDFTINSLYFDPFIGKVLDFHGGLIDLDVGVLKHTSDAYMEDPLRVLRAFQLISRFELVAEVGTVMASRTMLEEYDTLSKERIWEEWWKWATKGKRPGDGLDWLLITSWLREYPEIAALVGLKQDPEWHPEGDAFKHTKLAVNRAAMKADELGIGDVNRAIAVFGALCHDFGKATTTSISERSGRIIAKGHPEEGAGLAKTFLMRIGAPNWLIQKIVPLVREHMFYINDVTKRGVRRLANRLAPATITELVQVFGADLHGRGPFHTIPKKVADRIIDVIMFSHLMNIENEKPKPILLGRHLLELGMEPGPVFGRILKPAFEAQLDGVFEDLDGALAWARERMKDVG